MRKLFSTRYNAGAFNTALLILRLGFGILLAHHGYLKFLNFQQTEGFMMDFMGLGKSTTTCLVIFTELFCAILVIIGLFTRLACIPIIFLFIIIIFKATGPDFFGKSELPELYLAGFLAILLAGPGKASVDNMISK
ncbi:MAG: DoxX family protein [Bacteroidota bacterium]|nr:DoxX family protein [Bacteroidota bacterium]